MFRNPRENRELPDTARLIPSTGRAPSPPHSSSRVADMAAKPMAKKSHAQRETNGRNRLRPQGPANGNIMAFFKKAEDINNRIFLQERGSNPIIELDSTEEDVGWSDEVAAASGVISSASDDATRYNESGGSNKKRKLDDEALVSACSPPPPEAVIAPAAEALPCKAPELPKPRTKSGPFVDDSDDDDEGAELLIPRRGTIKQEPTEDLRSSKTQEDSAHPDDAEPTADHRPLILKTEDTSQFELDEFDEADLEDDELLEGEEYDERRWMKEQRKLEIEAAGFEGDPDDFDAPSLFPNETNDDDSTDEATDATTPTCPLCNSSLAGLSEQESSVHVNACLDGKPIPLPSTPRSERDSIPTPMTTAKAFKRPVRPPREAQANPFQLGAKKEGGSTSAFSKLMAGHAEDAAWATAAAANNAARGKPSFERTCPFYKIMPGFFIAVDAFRYGAVKGQNAYFLSHFHSDHYIGLTSSWSHGPIYCSKVTGNLVRQQLRVDPKWVVDLEFEKKTEIPGTDGVHCTMISANHCPGSSLFLFEKEINKGPKLKLQRVLHCGDFRACQMHIEHPLLRPDVIDAVSGTNRQQKLDVCYLDTTYLTPKYAFPPQQQVIQACADMCVSLNKVRADETDAWEQMKRDRAGAGMAKFVRKTSTDDPTEPPKSPNRGRLLVIVGTYSIGKERICVGIAKALGSLIYAPPNKQRICRALEDPELNALFTTDPRKGQVHMTPLFEIRADTLDDYLRDYADVFSRAVGFRPSGWNYRPPNSRLTDSPLVSTVLHSSNWKSAFSMKDLTPQRGSTGRASCFGVPYSEHSSFRELTMFCCALNIDKIIPTVNVGSAKSREKMKVWCEKWAADKKKNGLFRLGEDGWC
ncbi:DNA repair metallo-beta-lactamase-domain-containing protein [Boeremia exigua]|uniref:DNA repair metallo-beta-lactamase-domain-containing protein n=1 Tax=Boeremia exigua TaxID=749465 RepID=UPI001E8ECCB1|nr:DNA repair metallo-beta-lactamase-domain-containing protein [Boeremia exigua]KAH6638430.1 DNA repair metallo-beta-lactamase-domain-containing protein [Boeremia exigua]